LRSKVKLKSQGQFERKCKNRFRAYLSENWIDLHQTKTKMILGSLYGTHIDNTFHQRKCIFAIFVCLSVCHLPFVDSELKRRGKFIVHGILPTRLVNGDVILGLKD